MPCLTCQLSLLLLIAHCASGLGAAAAGAQTVPQHDPSDNAKEQQQQLHSRRGLRAGLIPPPPSPKPPSPKPPSPKPPSPPKPSSPKPPASPLPCAAHSPPSPPPSCAKCTGTQRCVLGTCVNTGDFYITVTWNKPIDLDLHVFTPANNHLYHANRGTPNSVSGAYDMDRNATGPENVWFAVETYYIDDLTAYMYPDNGDYRICMTSYLSISVSVYQPVTVTLEVKSLVIGDALLTMQRTFTKLPNLTSSGTCVGGSDEHMLTFNFRSY